MGAYTTDIITEEQFIDIVETIRDGYNTGHMKHRPNPQIATILILQANLGCRIGDIMALTTDSIVKDGSGWRLNIKEQKTGKSRNFIVPAAVKKLIDDFIEDNHIIGGRLFDIEAPAVWKAIRQATEYLGIYNVSCHSFRKFAGMRVYMGSGKDIALTTQFYQHSSPSCTMKYLKRTSKQMDEAISNTVCLPK